MDAIFRFLAASGSQLSVGTLLVAGFSAFAWALYTERLVLGGPYRRCMARVDRFEAEATKRAEANEAKTAKLESDFEAYKRQSDATISRLEAVNAALRGDAHRRS